MLRGKIKGLECVPETEHGGIMEKCHESPYGGHFAGDKTITSRNIP